MFHAFQDKREFSYDEKNTRSHIRNLCVGLNPRELRNLMKEYTGFSHDCIQEFLVEVEAE